MHVSAAVVSAASVRTKPAACDGAAPGRRRAMRTSAGVCACVFLPCANPWHIELRALRCASKCFQCTHWCPLARTGTNRRSGTRWHKQEEFWYLCADSRCPHTHPSRLPKTNLCGTSVLLILRHRRAGPPLAGCCVVRTCARNRACDYAVGLYARLGHDLVCVR